MLYFIPSWYSDKEWKENEQIWYVRRAHSEMDDSVKQIQLFHRNHLMPYCILLLSFSPNLRHFLHRQGLFKAPYWSAFDSIQEVRRKKTAVLSFHDLKWPEHTEFIYSQFAVIALVNGSKYAQIEFGEDGNPIRVDLFKSGQLVRRNIYDDRGFLSCTVRFEDGRMTYEQYLTEKGVWKICCFADGHVTVNPKSSTYLIGAGEKEKSVQFQKQSYADMEELISEVFQAFLSTIDPADIFCAAMHERHLNLIESKLQPEKTIISFFGNRVDNYSDPSVKELMFLANRIIADSNEQTYKIRSVSSALTSKIVNIPPYDARMDRGISQKLHVQNILAAVDNLADPVFEKIIVQTAGYLAEHDKARVVLFTRHAEYNREQQLLEKTQEILKQNGFPPEIAEKSRPGKAENRLEEEEKPILFSVSQCVDELSATRCIREQRLIIDLSPVPDLYLQINAISMGTPQITRRETMYLKNGKNGHVNRNGENLSEDIAFYLENLENWNYAMIQAYEIGREYTTENLLKKWREVIESVEKGNSAAAGGSQSAEFISD